MVNERTLPEGYVPCPLGKNKCVMNASFHKMGSRDQLRCESVNTEYYIRKNHPDVDEQAKIIGNNKIINAYRDDVINNSIFKGVLPNDIIIELDWKTQHANNAHEEIKSCITDMKKLKKNPHDSYEVREYEHNRAILLECLNVLYDEKNIISIAAFSPHSNSAMGDLLNEKNDRIINIVHALFDLDYHHAYRFMRSTLLNSWRTTGIFKKITEFVIPEKLRLLNNKITTLPDNQVRNHCTGQYDKLIEKIQRMYVEQKFEQKDFGNNDYNNTLDVCVNILADDFISLNKTVYIESQNARTDTFVSDYYKNSYLENNDAVSDSNIIMQEYDDMINESKRELLKTIYSY